MPTFQRHTIASAVLLSLLACSQTDPDDNSQTNQEPQQTQTQAQHSGENNSQATQPATDKNQTTTVLATAASSQRPRTGGDQALKEEIQSTRELVFQSGDDALNRRSAPSGKIVVPRLHQQAKRDGLAFALPRPSLIVPPENRENYQHLKQGGVISVAETPVSTFSIDVDTGSYSNMRRMINQGLLPPADAIRIEELINYFSYDYPGPEQADAPFSVTTELAPAPWNSDRRLLRIGLQGYHPDASQIKAANLVFLIDVSGSMSSPDKLPLLKQSLRLLSSQLGKEDNISIVVYAGAAGVVLEQANGDDQQKIVNALEQLHAGGSTHGSAGITQAYALARQHFITGGINRVILATDGDFNVGTVNIDSLKQLIKRQRQQGISLTTLGFGRGNYNDHLMEQLADVGNGNYAYIDNLNEARKVLVDEVNSTLQIIAKDVKIQVEFNPQQVAEYRLLGYENRALAREDFNNDRVDAGEIGAGHNVTALYELTLADSKSRRIDPLRYGQPTSQPSASEATDNAINNTSLNTTDNELGYLRLRYKTPQSDNSQLITKAILLDGGQSIDQASQDFRFAVAVASFGQLLKGGDYLEGFDYQDVLALAKPSRGDDTYGYRSEFIQLVRTSQVLAGQTPSARQRLAER